MDKNDKLEVSITQCQVCGTISTHYGAVVTESCTACSEAAHEMHNSVMEADEFRSNLGNEINKWIDEDHDEDANFLDNLDSLLGEYDYDSELSKGHPVFGSREWDELNEAIPLLNSIANTIYNTNEQLKPILDGINELLLSPSDHWSYMQQLELFRFKIDSKVDRINESILECQSLGYDVVDFEAALISSLASSPEFWFEGKDDIEEGATACFFFDGSTDTFNSFTYLGEPWYHRRFFNTPD